MPIELFECVRLAARINQVACDTNRKRGVFACGGCPGLGQSIKISTEDITVMGAKNKPCIEEGCKTMSWKSGYCWKHHPDHVANKKAACAEKKEIRDIHKAATVKEAREHVVEKLFTPGATAHSTPPVTEHEIHVVNLIDVFRQKQAAELAAFSEKIGVITDPVEKLLFTLKAVQI